LGKSLTDKLNGVIYMPTKAKMSTTGFDKYLETLVKLEADVDAAADAALQAGAEIMKKGMVKRAPEDTGNLKAHITIKGPDHEGNYHFVEVGVIDADATTARYANAQEYGSPKRAAHSYIRATMDEDKRNIKRAMTKAFKAYIQGAEAAKTSTE
jgi:HK97 gp10 family phage protein